LDEEIYPDGTSFIKNGVWERGTQEADVPSSPSAVDITVTPAVNITVTPVNITVTPAVDIIVTPAVDITISVRPASLRGFPRQGPRGEGWNSNLQETP
jgi:hypothetical protein